jgi:hypothetical protein
MDDEMPNKTIYIKDSDLETWEKAQKTLGGESISAILTDCLKERLRALMSLDQVEAINEVLNEVNEEQGLNLELHPFWPRVILDANTIDVGYKVHQKGAKPDRVMSLIVDPFNFAVNGAITPTARSFIKAAIVEFWCGKRTDLHTVVRVGAMDIMTRLQNLIGKKGLVNVAQAGELGFTILAVHPATSLAAEGDDAEFQDAITKSDFTVRFDDGILVDNSNVRVIAGRYISLIRGHY